MKQNNKTRGNHGEDMAAHELEKTGYTIICRNYRLKYGEIDIIAQKNNVLYFVEVKSKCSASFSRPAESVGAAKRRQVVNLAQSYMSYHGGERDCSFMIAEVYLDQQRVELIEDSFV